MQIYPTTATGGNTANPASATSTATSPTGGKTLGQDDFLKLLSVQMQAQDPLNPMKDTEFVAQMASFTSLEQMKSLTTSFDTFVSQQRSVDAQSYLGKSVTVLDPDLGSITGTVSGVNLTTDGPQIVVGGKAYDPTMISAIQSSSTNSASPSSTTALNK